ncbi:Ldh family oxidoreductase [Maritimibacter sp. UBA3975]|uniref:Ldh family oxidoreductase n=1 Tax=Maritimibacter sp. UBA3975 TaxID=1946833 RepID=UPI000C0A73F5|nr:Ldh family oxidoreductase [Maritimibacter sp. UBA3975]MAM63145.1 lactate dehydrogenase [Maritimibacter sp.]
MADPVRVGTPALTAFGRALMERAGVDSAQAESVTENLVWNDAAGRHNHGFERLPVLLDRVASGAIRCPAEISVREVGPALAHLDAGGGFGQHAGRVAVDRACDMAEAGGIGVVGVSGSNFYGTGAAFVARATARGHIAFALSNSYAKVAAHGGRAPVLGTNPLAFGAPLADGDLIVDFSTAALAGSTLRDAQATGTPLPEGLAIDTEGAPVTDPAQAAGATLLPDAGAKGFGLALMVEVLAGVLTGAGIGPEVGSLYADTDRPADNGHFFLVLDPGRWLPGGGFGERMAALAGMVAASAPEGVVRLPGAARAAALRESAEQGVALTAATWAGLGGLAERHGVALPKRRS